MKKTLIITLEYPPQIGGISTYISDYSKHLGGEVFIWAPKNKEVIEKENLFRGEPYFLLFWPKWLKLFFQIRKIVKKEKIELIHIHHVLPVGYIAYLIHKLYKIPYLVFLHGTDVQMAVRTRRKKKWYAKIVNNAEKIVVNSEYLKTQAIINTKSLIEKTVVVYPCPNNKFLQNYEGDLEKLRSELALGGKKVILTASRIAEGKGHSLFLQVLPEIIKEMPNVIWLVAGSGEKSDVFWKIVREKNLQNFVRYLGDVPNGELQKYYNLADLFLLLTHKDKENNLEEGFGLVFLEAGAVGLPSVAGISGGVQEAVINNKTGFVVDAYDGISVKSAVIRLLQDEELSKSFGENAKNRVAQEFVWEKQLTKIL
ncbi:MAG: glycosyltransferase family 4 protein [Candidatus Magasanikbacteria bacterium]|nr:glycosyltransferase family 4 protein [Candidatus Magasanikbacteria bacterium]